MMEYWHQPQSLFIETMPRITWSSEFREHADTYASLSGRELHKTFKPARAGADYTPSRSVTTTLALAIQNGWRPRKATSEAVKAPRLTNYLNSLWISAPRPTHAEQLARATDAVAKSRAARPEGADWMAPEEARVLVRERARLVSTGLCSIDTFDDVVHPMHVGYAVHSLMEAAAPLPLPPFSGVELPPCWDDWQPGRAH